MAAVFYGWEQTRSSSEETRSAGVVIGRVVDTSIYRMPDNILLREQKDTYAAAPLGGGFSGSGLKLSKSDVKTCVWDGSVYGPNGPVNQPKQRSELTRSFAWVSDDSASPQWVEVSKTETTYGYDGFTDQVAIQSTQKWIRARATSGFALTPQAMTVKRTKDQGPNWVAVTTDNYSWNSSAGTWTIDPLASADNAIGGGKRAGGLRSGGG